MKRFDLLREYLSVRQKNDTSFFVVNKYILITFVAVIMIVIIIVIIVIITRVMINFLLNKTRLITLHFYSLLFDFLVFSPSLSSLCTLSHH